jgi:CubicO group peptidase (beta-lactamase class C family)
MKTRLGPIALALLSCIIGCCQAGPSPASNLAAEKGGILNSDTMRGFEQELARLRDELNIPGMSVAVLQGQEIVFARGFGYADVENRIPATADTPYHIASLTKPFSAALIMQLVEAGQLDLDAKMADLLRDASFQYGGGTLHGYASICKKLKELGQDASGPYARYRFLFQDYRCDTERITVRHHLTHTSQGKPGRTYRYNGYLFGFLTQVVEQAAGKPYAKLLADRITAPLEMTSSVPNPDEERQRQILERRAKPYHIDDTGDLVVSQYPQGMNAAAGMVSTVLDLAKFDVAMDDNLLVSEASKKAMFSPTLSTGGRALPYGLGWFVQERGDLQMIWHYGHQPGSYSSLILKLPDEEMTLILLANSEGASAPFDLGAGDVLKSPFARLFIAAFIEQGLSASSHSD